MVAVVIVVVAVAGLSSYYFLLSTSATQSNASASGLQSSACASAVAVTNYVFRSPPPNKQVLLLQPGSTAIVCVTYETIWTNSSGYAFYQKQYFGNGSLKIPFQVWNDITVQNGSTTTQVIGPAKNGTSTTTTITNAPIWSYHSKPYFGSFSVVVKPNSIAPFPRMATFTIVYAITPRDNSSGFYSDFGPAPGLLVSVGHNSAQVTASDFPYAGVVKPGGPPFPYRAVSVSVIGAPVVNLSVPAGWPYGGPPL